MKRRVFLSGALAAGASACRRDPRPRLNVYNWSAYVAPDTIPNFEKEFGVRMEFGRIRRAQTNGNGRATRVNERAGERIARIRHTTPNVPRRSAA